MMFASKNEQARAERRDEANDRVSRVYVETSPCVVMRAIDLAATLPTRFAVPKTMHEYMT